MIKLLVSFLKKLQQPLLIARTIHRRVVLRLFGLKTGSSCVISYGVRWPLFNLKQITIGNKVQIGKNSHFFIPATNKSAKIQVGDNSCLGIDFTICALGGVTIGRDCAFAQGVYISDAEHITGRGIIIRESGLEFRGVVIIEDRCLIGRNVTILPGVHLGSNCVVGAGSVVAKSFPPNSVVLGIPAKIVKILE